MNIRIRKILSDLLYPRRCPLCDTVLGRAEALLCTACAQEAQPAIYGFRNGFAVFPYAGVYRESMRRFKYRGRAEYADYYASAILRAGSSRILRFAPEACVPVPIHPARRAERGYNQAEELASALAARLGIPCLPLAVARRRATRPQNALTPRERQENVRGAFGPGKRPFLPERILLVDDIHTTGSTLEELEKTVRGSGVRAVLGVCVCMASSEENGQAD